MAQGNGQQPGTALVALAKRLEVEPAELTQTLTQTVFKGASQAQMTALCIVANEYGLNPFVKELFAFPSKNGIVPMVSIDGWLRIINSHPQMAGMDIVYATETAQVGGSKRCPEYIEVTIHRKDRPHTSSPIREYLDECYRPTEPWNGMTRRMLRHKAIMQAGRVAFSLSGIYDQDEANDILAHEGKRIVETDAGFEVIDGEASEVPEGIGEEAWAKLLSEAADLEFSEDDIMANAAAFGYEGTGPEMPRPVAENLYRAMKQASEERKAAAKAKARQARRDAQEEQAAAAENVTPLHPDPATDGQLAEIDELYKASGMYEAEFASIIESYGDFAADRYALTEETAGFVLEALHERAAQ